MRLDASMVVDAGPFRLEVDLAVEDGEVLAVLGPNGAGKTTLLRALAGLNPITSGHITLDDTVLDDPSTGTFVLPEDRPVGVVFQGSLLFPHLDARDNVAFGIPGRRAAARGSAEAWLDRVGLGNRARSRVAELSGGQAQRVALARTLATEPALLLLDEPLAALDARTRGGIRRDLRRLLREFDGVRILVTHDPVDAFALADRVLVIEDGRVTQEGTPAEVAARPRTEYVAELVGTNLLVGVATAGVVTTRTGATLVTATQVEGPVLAVVPPSGVSLHRVRPEGSPRNVWQGHISHIDHLVDRVRVRLDGPLAIVADVTAAAAASLELHDDDEVWLAIKATEIEVYET
jgi:molybdate transport system ATP-binding protein